MSTPRPQVAKYFQDQAKQQATQQTGLCAICGDWARDPNFGADLHGHHPKCPEVTGENMALHFTLVAQRRSKRSDKEYEPIWVAEYSTREDAETAAIWMVENLISLLKRSGYHEIKSISILWPDGARMWTRRIEVKQEPARETTVWRRLFWWWR